MDGGGTKTKSVLVDEKMNIISSQIGGPSNFLMIGNEVVSETIFNLINQTLKNSNLSIEQISGIVLGTTGGGRRSDAESLEKSIINFALEKNFHLKNFRVESDARIALEGAFSGKPGCILIAGTGSIMFGKDSKGIIHRVGGFGRFIGDEGSGFKLGQKGLIAVAKEFDGRGNKTLITELLREKFNIENPENLITEIYRNNFDIASIAPLVIQASEKGDHIAEMIIEAETDELIIHIEAMQRKLNENILFVSLIGSIITSDNFYSLRFKEKVVQKLNYVILKEAENPPEIGAAIMAKNLSA
jgi:N-acetylglucosamine kinase-like BadF-type ATPase